MILYPFNWHCIYHRPPQQQQQIRTRIPSWTAIVTITKFIKPLRLVHGIQYPIQTTQMIPRRLTQRRHVGMTYAMAIRIKVVWRISKKLLILPVMMMTMKIYRTHKIISSQPMWNRMVRQQPQPLRRR